MQRPYSEIRWWIDQNGSTHSNKATPVGSRPLAQGKNYPDSKSGVIEKINGKPATVAMISQQLLDILHSEFPGTRWWVKDPAEIKQKQTAS